MEIRSAGIEDIALLTHIIRDSFRDVATRFSLTPENCPTHPSFITGERLESAFERGTLFFLAECADGPCGCVAMEAANAKVRYLERLGVLPAYRGRGYGKRLVEHIVREARETGAGSLEIGVIADQEDLRDWYAELGFEEKARKSFDHLPFEVLFMAYTL